MLESYYYHKQLYPLQDKVLELIAQANSDFYLTGGTALGRYYLQHRYSDDLDFFVNLADDFANQVDRCLDILRKEFSSDIQESLKGDSFVRCFVNQGEIRLKIEFINDVLFRVGSPQATILYAKTDTIENIISNKICALSREEAKDLADIWYIARNFELNWKEVIEHAKQKDTWVDETEVLLMLKKFDINKLKDVKWIQAFDVEKAEKDRNIILKDVLLGTQNSLYKKA
jgi:hypothetical protein